MADLLDATLRAAVRREAAGARAALRARGVVPTPAEVARRAVARLDELLRRELGVPDGLASERVVVVDPAVGTGVWLAALLEHTRVRGAAAQLIGIELDPGALATARDLLHAEAAAQGARLELREANALELACPFPVGEFVRVVFGNPPWSARSLSRGGSLSDAWLAEFRRDHTGRALAERRAGVLSDDYVRFFRWALEQARTSAHGAALCLATNDSYLDGPVHRGMRGALVRAFDHIELVDLGGNSLLSRGAGADENVFGVRVGAALTWAVRKPRRDDAPAAATVSLGHVRGTRVEKLAALATGTIALSPCAPSAPWFLFRAAPPPSEPGFSLAEALPFHREGVQTNRDALAIAASPAALEARADAILRGTLELASQRHFDPARVRRALARARERDELPIERLAYRPLDPRFVLALAPLCHRPRPELLRALRHSSLCLLTVRKERGAAPFNLFAVSRTVADACFLSTRSSCRTRVFPSHTPDGAPNLSSAIAAALAERIGRAPSSCELIAYALGVLGAPRFRARNERALKLDYARLPWPADAAAFERTVNVGERFIAALCDPPRATAAVALGRELAPETAVPLRALRYDACGERVMLGASIVCTGVRSSWWAAQVGHHALVQSACAGAALPIARLVGALTHAAQWVEAEAAADALCSP